MTVTEDQLAAYADGELSADEAKRVAAAIADNPALAARLDAEIRLRAQLRSHFDPVADEPVPESLTLLIATMAAQEVEEGMTDAAPAKSPSSAAYTARVLDLAAARARRNETQRPSKAAGPTKRNLSGRWKTVAAMAACVALGVGLGVRLPQQGSARMGQDGRLVAAGSLATGLETRLASADASAGNAGSVRIFSSFQRPDLHYCRVYAAGATSGIACKEGGDWILERTMATSAPGRGEYRQAGSLEGDLMAAAQNMANGAPLTPSQEQSARSTGWHGSR